MSLQYVELGNPDDETIIFLHGAGMASWSWHGVTALLPQYHTIAVDLPGHGDSHQVQAESLENMAHIVADFIAEITKGEKAHVVSLSLGAITTIEMLCHRPEVVKSAVISGVNATPLPFMMKMMVNLTKPLMKMDFFIRQNAKLYQLDDEASQAYFTGMKQLDMKTFNNIIPEIVNYAPVEKLQGLNIPSLFVAGGNEQSINVESVSLLANAVEFGAGVLAPKLHHGWSGENPDLFAQMVDQWVTSNEIADGLDVKVDKRPQLEMA